MKKIKKTIICLLSAMFLLVFLTPTCLAVEVNPIMPRWTGVGEVDTELTFYDAVGTATAVATKRSSCTSLEGVMTIYEHIDGEWILVDSTTKSTTRTSLGLTIEFDAESGVEYKAEFCITAYNGTTIIEEITDTKYGTCP